MLLNEMSTQEELQDCVNFDLLHLSFDHRSECILDVVFDKKKKHDFLSILLRMLLFFNQPYPHASVEKKTTH